MSRSKLLQPAQNARPPKRAAAPEPVRSRPAGPDNRDLLSRLGSAKTMPGPVQAKMEETLGADFSRVRLYESPLVAELGAEAAASGDRVAFAPGKLDMKGSAGLELLGHELSHVASQARGEVVGSGFLRDPALERKADEDGARAMRAFDAVSGGELTPMSAGPAPASPAGPVQAKKDKDKTPGELLIDAYNDQDLTQQVETMRNLAIVESADPYQDRSESDAYFQLAQQATPKFMDEILRQQAAAARALNQTRQSLSGGGTPMENAEAEVRAKFSPEASVFQGYSTLLKDIGLNTGGGESYMYYLDQMRALKTAAPGVYAEIEAAQNTIMGDSRKNIWAQAQGDEALDALQDDADARDKAFARNWVRPKRRGFLARLFGRR